MLTLRLASTHDGKRWGIEARVVCDCGHVAAAFNASRIAIRDAGDKGFAIPIDHVHAVDCEIAERRERVADFLAAWDAALTACKCDSWSADMGCITNPDAHECPACGAKTTDACPSIRDGFACTDETVRKANPRKEA